MLMHSVIKCFGPTDAEMWHVALSSLAAKQQQANRYVVSKPSNSKWHVQTHICRREREINSPKKIGGNCFARFDFCLVPK